MSIFREHKTTADRSASDRARHKKKIEKAIREGITDVVADESIIGHDGKKKIKIPVRGIKEWQFIYGDNEGHKQVGSAPGQDVQKGQVVKKGQQQQGQGNKAGKDKGEEAYEVEITLEELAEYLFDSLQLPDLDRKKFKKLLDHKPRKHGTRPHGIRPRLDKKKTAVERIKRLSASRKSGTVDINPETGEEEFPFHDNDLRYYYIKDKPKEATDAVIFFMMDVSGSMTTNIKYIARSFYFLLYQFLRHKYEHIEIVFIAHTTEAEEVDEERFFKRAASGGTHVSSAPRLALDIINKRYHPSSWNIYAFHCTDGDNWDEDNDEAFDAFKELSNICQLLCYTEIALEGERPSWQSDKTSKLWNMLSKIEGGKLRLGLLGSAQDIWPSFKRLFGGLPDV
jgi:sporulation protein YhbH